MYKEKKWKLAPSDILPALDEICTACAILFIDENTIRQALEIHEKYSYSYYDCLMLASALTSGCKYLFSEDMSDGQIINETLEIVNIFRRDIG